MTEQRPTNPLSKANTARFFTISPESGILQHADAAAAIQNLPSGGYWWFDYCEPALSQLEPLIAQFGIHPLSIEDSLAEDQLPKLDHYPNYSFMIFNFYEQTEDELLTHELDLFLGKNFLISISHLNQLGLPLLTGIDKSVERELPKITLGPSFLAHLMIDVVVDRKFYAIDSIENKLDQDENRILGEAQDFDLSTLLNSRRDLMTIRRSLFYEREVVNKLLRVKLILHSLIYYRDIWITCPNTTRFRNRPRPGDQPDGAAPLHDQQPYGGIVKPHQRHHAPSDPDHDHFYAAQRHLRYRRDVRIYHDDRSKQYPRRLPGFVCGDVVDRGYQLSAAQTDGKPPDQRRLNPA